MQDGSQCSKEQPYIMESGEAKTKPVALKAGYYRLVLYGDDLSEVSVSSEYTMDAVASGTKRLVYQFYVGQDAKIDFIIHSQEQISITNISLETCTE